MESARLCRYKLDWRYIDVVNLVFGLYAELTSNPGGNKVVDQVTPFVNHSICLGNLVAILLSR